MWYEWLICRVCACVVLRTCDRIFPINIFCTLILVPTKKKLLLISLFVCSKDSFSFKMVRSGHILMKTIIIQLCINDIVPIMRVSMLMVLCRSCIHIFVVVSFLFKKKIHFFPNNCFQFNSIQLIEVKFIEKTKASEQNIKRDLLYWNCCQREIDVVSFA